MDWPELSLRQAARCIRERVVSAEVLPRHKPEYAAYLRKYDLRAIAFPTTPLLPPPLGETGALNGEPVSNWHNLRNAVPAMLLGAPCLSLPIPVSDGGLPIGLEIDGWPRANADLLKIGLAWEVATRTGAA